MQSENTKNQDTPSKKAKTDYPEKTSTSLELIRQFEYEKVLASNAQERTAAFLGKIAGENAILKLEKTPFPTVNVEIKKLFQENRITELEEHAVNDVYHWGINLLDQSLVNPSCKFSLIYPATDTHIAKFESTVYHFVRETPEIYQRVVRPYIESMQGDRLKWVRNILFKGAEAERVVHRNEDSETGYVLVPDMKWDGKTIDTLYICAIVLRQDIGSIRDLNSSHVAWLTQMQDDIRRVVPEYYEGEVSGDSLRVFVHYQPSYYHFHIHIVNVSHPGLSSTMTVGRAILLQDIIDWLEYLGPKGFLGKTLTYAIPESHKLWELGLKDATI